MQFTVAEFNRTYPDGLPIRQPKGGSSADIQSFMSSIGSAVADGTVASVTLDVTRNFVRAVRFVMIGDFGALMRHVDRLPGFIVRSIARPEEWPLPRGAECELLWGHAERRSFDPVKRDRLVHDLRASGVPERGEPGPAVALDRFYDGNEDSISFSPTSWPLQMTFGQVRTYLSNLQESGVADVYIQIASCEQLRSRAWPMADAMLFDTRRDTAEVESWLKPLYLLGERRRLSAGYEVAGLPAKASVYRVWTGG